MPCASVSAKRTFTSVEKPKSTVELSTIGAVDAPGLARLIRANQPCVVLTGAGVSTESGIPDFRSPTGIWAEFDPTEYASLPAFRADPTKVWRFYKPRIAMLAKAEPNAAHRALAALEEAGFVEAVVTQNIDLLHERAGSRNLVQVHGSIRTATCPACGASYPRAAVVDKLERSDAPPCDRCDRAGLRARTVCASAARGRFLARGASRRGITRRNTDGRRARRDRQQRADALRWEGRSETGRERRDGPRRGCRRACLGDGAPERAFPEKSAALAAVHALDLVGNALPLAQRVARHLGMPVWCPSPERDCLTHLTQGNFVLGTYDARKGEEVVTKRRRSLRSLDRLASASRARETTKGTRWLHGDRAV